VALQLRLFALQQTTGGGVRIRMATHQEQGPPMNKPVVPPAPVAPTLTQQKADFTAEGSPPPGKVATKPPKRTPAKVNTPPPVRGKHPDRWRNG
jgi:hypothetical protein